MFLMLCNCCLLDAVSSRHRAANELGRNWWWGSTEPTELLGELRLGDPLWIRQVVQNAAAAARGARWVNKQTEDANCMHQLRSELSVLGTRWEPFPPVESSERADPKGKVKGCRCSCSCRSRCHPHRSRRLCARKLISALQNFTKLSWGFPSPLRTPASKLPPGASLLVSLSHFFD